MTRSNPCASEPESAVLRVRMFAKRIFLFAVVVAVALQYPILHASDWSLFDLRIYLDGGHAVFHDPAALYTTAWEGGWPFTYPTFSALVFSILDLPSEAVATALVVVGSTLALARISYLIARGIVDHLPGRWLRTQPDAIASAVVFGAATGILLLAAVSDPIHGTIGFGQINLIVAWLTVEDFLGFGARTRGRGASWRAGVLTGIAAGIKITPALLLIPRLLAGDWRAARNGALSWAATVAISAAVMPQQTYDYFTRWLWDTSRPGDPWYQWNLSLSGTVHRFAGPDGSPLQWILVGLAVVAGIYVATIAVRTGDGAGAVLVGWLTIYLVSPITWYHHLVLVPALLAWLLAGDRHWSQPWRSLVRLQTVLLAITAIPGVYQLIPRGNSVEFDHTTWQAVLGEAFPLTALWLLVTLAAAALAHDPAEPARRGPEDGGAQTGSVPPSGSGGDEVSVPSAR